MLITALRPDNEFYMTHISGYLFNKCNFYRDDCITMCYIKDIAEER